jgi:hypothetical protein
MSSILKVDQLQDSGGNAIITSDGSGNVTQSKAGITQADLWRLSTDKTADADPLTDLERADDPSGGIIGTGMSESSGVFTFPSTGIYLIQFTLQATTVSDSAGMTIHISTNSGSSYDEVARVFNGGNDSRNNNASSFALIDVTDISTFRFKSKLTSIAGTTTVHGSTTTNETCITFIRLGDT